MTRIAVIGPGAIGGTIAAWLCQNPQHQLTLCARTPLARLEVATPQRTLVVTPHVITDPNHASAVDWVLVATKAYDAIGAARWFPRLLTPHTRIAILQNGVEHVARFSPFAPAGRLVPVIVECPADRVSPDQLRQKAPASLVVPAGAAGADFVALFAGTSIDARTTADWTTAAWRKLALNAAGAVSAVTLQPAGVVHLPAVADVMRGLTREAIAVGRAEGAQLDDSLVDETLAHYQHAPRDSINSLHADRLAGRPLESDARNGVIVRLGRKHGIPTPYNESAFAYLETIVTR